MTSLTIRPQNFLSSIWLPLIAFLLPLAAYITTLCPTVYTLDSAELVTGAYSLGIVHATGCPLYLLIGKLFTYLPIGDVAYRVNLMSALFAALTIVVLYQTLTVLTKRPFVSLTASLLFAFSFYFWRSAVVAEVHTLDTFLIATVILILLTWEQRGTEKLLYLFSFMYGLSLGNRMSGSLLAFGLVYFLLATNPKQVLKLRNLLLMASCFLVGLSIYLYLPLRYSADPPLNYVKNYYQVDLTSLSGILWMMSGQMYRFFMFGYDLPQAFAETTHYLHWLWRDFLGTGLLIGLFGVLCLYKEQRRVFFFTLLLYAANVFFFVNYRVIDKDTMFLPSYPIWTLWIAYGYEAIAGWLSNQRFDNTFLDSKLNTRKLLLGTLALIALLAAVLNFRWVDQSDNRSARVFADSVFNTVEPNSLLMCQWQSAVILEYCQIVEGQRPDVSIFNRSRYGVASYYKLWIQNLSNKSIFKAITREEMELIDKEISKRPIYIVNYNPALPQYGECYRLRKGSDEK